MDRLIGGGGLPESKKIREKMRHIFGPWADCFFGGKGSINGGGSLNIENKEEIRPEGGALEVKVSLSRGQGVSEGIFRMGVYTGEWWRG